jgi:hypothetical protein
MTSAVLVLRVVADVPPRSDGGWATLCLRSGWRTPPGPAATVAGEVSLCPGCGWWHYWEGGRARPCRALPPSQTLPVDSGKGASPPPTPPKTAPFGSTTTCSSLRSDRARLTAAAVHDINNKPASLRSEG